METELFNLLVGGGPFGVVAAFFFWKWQQSEGTIASLRAAAEVKTEAGHKFQLELQEKALTNAARTEEALRSNTTAMQAQSQLMQTMISGRKDHP